MRLPSPHSRSVARRSHALAALFVIAVAAAFAGGVAAAVDAPPLPPLLPRPLPALPSFRGRVNTSSVTVSGISSGAAFAAQFTVAFSGTVRGGAAVFAGKPWACERVANPSWAPGVSSSTCNTRPDVIRLDALVDAAVAAEKAGEIDPLSGLSSGRFFVYRGSSDPIYREVGGVSALNFTAAFFARFAGEASVARAIDTLDSGHCVPTLGYGVSPCRATGSPYLNKCGVDGAGDALRWLLPGRALVRDPSAVNPARLSWFDQTPFFWGPDGPPAGVGPSPGLGNAGAVYVPAACTAIVDNGAKSDAEGASGGRASHGNHSSGGVPGRMAPDQGGSQRSAPPLCDLHVSLHGCGMDNATIGWVYVDHVGLLEWAERSNVVVLFPQTGGATVLANAPKNATPVVQHCWDNYGLTGADYALRTGREMAAVERMIRHVLGASGRAA